MQEAKGIHITVEHLYNMLHSKVETTRLPGGRIPDTKWWRALDAVAKARAELEDPAP